MNKTNCNILDTWTEEEIIVLIDMLNRKIAIQKIAKTLNKKDSSVWSKMSSLELSSVRTHWSKQDTEQLIELRGKNLTTNEICLIMNKTIDSVNNWSKKLNIQTERSKGVMRQKELNKIGKFICQLCQIIKPYEDFYDRNGGPSNKSYCKDCNNIMSGKKNRLLSTNSSVEIILRHKLNSAKHRSKQYNREFNLDLDYLIEIFHKQRGMCYYSGIAMDLNTKSILCVSIDRIDSSEGYTKGNVVLCGNYVNKMKLDLSVMDFVNMCKLIFLNCGELKKSNIVND